MSVDDTAKPKGKHMSERGEAQTPAGEPEGRPPQGDPGPAEPPTFEAPISEPPVPEPPAPGPSPPPPPPSAPTTLTPEQMKQKLTSLGAVNPLPSLIVGGVSYLGAFLVSVIAVVLTAVTVAIAGGGEAVEAPLGGVGLPAADLLGGVGVAIRAPFQLVAMATLGSLGVSASFAGESLRVSMRILPAVMTVVMVLLAFYGGRRVQRRQGAGAIGIWSSAALTGLAVALFTVLAAFVFAQPIPVDADITLRLHAAGLDAFLGAWVLVTLALALGRISLRPRPSWWPLVADLTAGMKLAVSHALILTVLGALAVTVVTTIQALVEGEMPPMLFVLLLLPLIGGQVLAYFTGLPMLSSATASITAPDALGFLLGNTSGAVSGTLFDLPWYAWMAGLLIGGLVLVVASLLWQHQRRMVPNNVISLGVGWAALPLTYVAGGIALLVLAQLSGFIQLDGGGFLEGEQRATASLGLAAWTPALAGLAGVIVELLSRFVAPLMAPLVPAALLDWFRRPLAPAAVSAGPAPSAPVPPAGAPHPAPAPAASAQASAQQPGAQQPDGPVPAPPETPAAPATSPYATVPVGATVGAAVGGSDGDPQTPRTPMSRRTRRRVIGAGVATGALFVIAAGLAVALNIVSSTVFAPEKSVEAYLTALQDGDVATAMELAPPNVPTAQRALLTDAVAGSAENRISGYRIVDSTERGDDSVEVSAEVTQDGVATTHSYLVERDGRTAVLFPQWRMGEVQYPSIELRLPQGVTTLLINGQEFAAEDLGFQDGIAHATVLPGTYTVALASSSEFLTVVDSSVHVSADQTQWYELFVSPSFEISEAGRSEVQAQVNALLDECAVSTDPDPENCPFGTWSYEIVEGSGSWTIDAHPTVTVEEGWEGWVFSTHATQDAGSATYTYQREAWFEDEPLDESAEVAIWVSGDVVLTEDGQVEVEFSTW